MSKKTDSSFETRMEELDQIVRKLNEGNVTLDEMIALYERGMQLSKQCDDILNAYDAKIETLTSSFGASLEE